MRRSHLLALAVFALGIFLWRRAVRRVRTMSVGALCSGGNCTSGEDLVASGQEQARAWSQALGFRVIAFGDTGPGVDIGDLEDHAYDSGAPTDWHAKGWPTPCGPSSDPRRYCGGFGG